MAPSCHLLQLCNPGAVLCTAWIPSRRVLPPGWHSAHWSRQATMGKEGGWLLKPSGELWFPKDCHSCSTAHEHLLCSVSVITMAIELASCWQMPFGASTVSEGQAFFTSPESLQFPSRWILVNLHKFLVYFCSTQMFVFLSSNLK